MGYLENAISNIMSASSLADMAVYYTKYGRDASKLVDRGATIIKNARAATDFVKTIAKPASQSQDLIKASSAVVKGAKAASKAKSAALGILGAADVAGDLLVKSDIDNSVFTFVPGAGLVEGGAAIINACFGTNYLNARPIWM